MESSGAYVDIEFYTVIFAWFLCSFGPPSRSLVAYQLERGGMPLHDVVGVNCRKDATTDIKAQVPSIWLRGVCWTIVHV